MSLSEKSETEKSGVEEVEEVSMVFFFPFLLLVWGEGGGGGGWRFVDWIERLIE